MARGFSRSGGGGRSGGSGGGFSFGGGGGRSSGGGFSFGSSRSSSSHSYSSGGHYHSRPPRPRRPWHVPMFGRTVIVSTRAQSIFSLFIVLILFATVMCFFNARSVGNYTQDIKDQKQLIQEYETRDKDYKTLIQGAQNGTYNIQYFDISQFWNPSSQTFRYRTHNSNSEPTIPGIYDIDFYRNGQEYFFVVFEYNDGVNDKTDWTFTQYTKYQLEDILSDPNNPGKIAIAVGRLTNTASNDDGIWAINMDYSLESNQDYHYEVSELSRMKTQKNSSLKTALIFLGVDLLIVGGIVFYLVKKFKTAQRKADAEIAKTEAETKLATEQAKQINRTCDYCGASVPDGEDMCPACGSRVFEEKD